jgi:type IV secretion system protein TrbL
MKALHKAALTGAVLLLYSAGAAAQLTNQGLFDQVVTEFATRATSWQSVVMNAAMWLFWTLFAISLVWTGGMMILRKADIGEFFAEFVRFCLFFGFFLWLLRNGPAFATSIIQSLQRLGEQASGVSSVTPSGIVDIGFMIFKQSLVNMSLWSPIDSVIGFVLSLGILLLLATVGVNMLLLFVSSWILMYAGVFFLGFGGSRWTSDMAINYYKTVLGVAVQIFAMVLLVGIGVDLLSSFYAKMNKGTLNFEELGVMLVFCFALLMLINKIPGLLSGVITGAGISQAGIGSFGAGAVAGAALGAAGMAATAASMAGAAVMGGAQSIAGGVSAVKEAFAKAQAAMDGGSGQMPSFGGDSGSAGGGSSGGGDSSPYAQAAGFGGSSSGGSSSASTKDDEAEGLDSKDKDAGGSNQGKANNSKGGQGSASGGMARAAVLTVGAAAELAKGAGSLAKNKAAQLAADFQERASETVGGQVAATIRASLAQDAPTFEGNSLAADDDEVAAFVNKTKGA